MFTFSKYVGHEFNYFLTWPVDWIIVDLAYRVGDTFLHFFSEYVRGIVDVDAGAGIRIRLGHLLIRISKAS
jgi:hypothetical protein